MKYTLQQIQSIIGGEVVGDENTYITGVASIQSAKKGDITFIKTDDLISQALKSQASAFVVHRKINELDKPQIIQKNPFLSFTKLMGEVTRLNFFHKPGIHPTAVIGQKVTIGRDCAIGAYAIIEEGAVIGDNVVIYPHAFIGKQSHLGEGSVLYSHVSVREYCSIGKRAVIHCNSVIGDDGFGYIQSEKKHVKIPQIGTVEIGDDVEIGSMTTICRAALDKTVIGNGVKIDNHSHVAHNVSIGDDTMLVGYAKIAGSSKIGKNVMLAEDVGVTDHITIGDNCTVGGGSKVYKSLKPNSVVWGAPAKELNEEKRIQVLIKKLPEMYHIIKRYMKQS